MEDDYFLFADIFVQDGKWSLPVSNFLFAGVFFTRWRMITSCCILPVCRHIFTRWRMITSCLHTSFVHLAVAWDYYTGGWNVYVCIPLWLSWSMFTLAFHQAHNPAHYNIHHCTMFDITYHFFFSLFFFVLVYRREKCNSCRTFHMHKDFSSLLRAKHTWLTLDTECIWTLTNSWELYHLCDSTSTFVIKYSIGSVVNAICLYPYNLN